MNVKLLVGGLILGTIVAGAAAADHSVLHDVVATIEDPTNPSTGSIKNPCWKDGGCGGCGPDLVEWVVGPIYCP